MPEMIPNGRDRAIKKAIRNYLKGYLFSLEPNYVEEMDKGKISKSLRQEFLNKGKPLASHAEVRLQSKGKKWLIENGNEKYTVLKHEKLLAIFLSPSFKFDINKKEDFQRLGLHVSTVLSIRNDAKLCVRIKNEFINMVREEVNYYRGMARFNFNLGCQAHFEKLSSHVSSELAIMNNLYFRVLNATLLFGPRTSFLSRKMFKRLVDLLKEHITDPNEQSRTILEFMIVFGLGNYRDVIEDSDDWDGQWPGSWQAIRWLINDSVNQCITALQKKLKFKIQCDASFLSHKIIEAMVSPDKFRFLISPENSISIAWNNKSRELHISHNMIKLLKVPLGAKQVLTVANSGAELNAPKRNVPIPGDTRVVISARENGAIIELFAYESVLKSGESTAVLNADGHETTVSVGDDITHLLKSDGEESLEKGNLRTIKGISIQGQEGNRKIPDGFRLKIKQEGSKARIYMKQEIKIGSKESAEIIGLRDVAFSVWECACGHIGCAERHRISSWNPTYSLAAFLATAVKGIAVGKNLWTVAAGSFVQGMLYAIMVADTNQDILNGRLRYAPIEYKVCSCKNKFHGAKCDRGHENDSFDPQKMKRIAKDALILTGNKQAYEQLALFRCKNKNCKNLYEILPEDLVKANRCEICGAAIFGKEFIKDVLKQLSGFRHRHYSITRAKLWREMKRSHAQQKKICRSCVGKVELTLRCPLCQNELSQRETSVWLRGEPFKSQTINDNILPNEEVTDYEQKYL
jgi:hypothetical protein